MMIVSIISVAKAPANVAKHHVPKHTIKCHKKKCLHHIALFKHHLHIENMHKLLAEQNSISTFDLCVANNENGEPGSLEPGYINWYAVNEYYGAYSFLHSTWEAAGGLRFAYNANEASPVQQTIIFNSYEAIDPGAWPNTVPPCLSYK